MSSGIALSGSPALNTSTGSPAVLRRRSSNFSDYSQDARDLLNPRPLGQSSSSYAHSYSYSYSGEALRHQQPTSSWDSLPLAFALLPAVGGLLVQGGSSFVTDLMLLCLGGIFLHWSVTQPWRWYHSAQQIREEHEADTAEVAVDSEEEEEDEEGEQEREDGETARSPSPVLEDVQEETDESGTAKDERRKTTTSEDRVEAYTKKQRVRRQQARRGFRTRRAAALRELYRHEVLALLSCFACPALGAYLLHALRDQLTRPSESLISNFNLTVFLLGAEVRPLRHLLQIVQARTLYLQRVVHANPYREEEEQYRERREQEERAQNQTLTDLVHRLECLEGGVPAPAPPVPPEPTNRDRNRDRDLLREARAQLQPELDTLARALRRTHKQQALLENQVASRFRATEQRLSEAVSIAATPRRPSAGSTAWLYVVGGWAAVLWMCEAAAALLLYMPRRVVQCAGAAFRVVGVADKAGRETVHMHAANEADADRPSIIGGTIRAKNKKTVARPVRDVDYGYGGSPRWRA